PPHVDGPVGDRPIAAEGVSSGRLADRLDAEIDVRRQPLVQSNLFLAGAPARVDGAEVQETEVDRTLHLPDVVADQEHPRRVRGEHLHAAGRGPAVRLGPRQIVDQLAGVAVHSCGDHAAIRTWSSPPACGRGCGVATATTIERGRALNGPTISRNVPTPQHTAITSSVNVDRKTKG